jgi:hypothetical protein
LAQSAGRCLFDLFNDRCRGVDGFGREIEVNEAQLFPRQILCRSICADGVTVILFFAKCDDCVYVCVYKI